MSEAAGQRAEALIAILEGAASVDYIGEPVSQLEHALQAAALAVRARAADEEVLAALFHDLGHLCAPAGTPIMDGFGAVAHERIGADRLRAAGLPERVADLVCGHVQAKRYLVARTAGYLAGMSPASRRTLEFQGGPMLPAEAAAFEQDPLFAAKLRLRRWDELAKEPGARVAGAGAYREMLLRALESR
jgi:predicted HD phosphohydrolase